MIPTDGVVFPLKDEYTRQNDTLAGLSEGNDTPDWTNPLTGGADVSQRPSGDGFVSEISGTTFTRNLGHPCSFLNLGMTVRIWAP